MDLRYEAYISPKYKFYKPETNHKNATKFKLKYPDGWKDYIDEAKHWRYAMPEGMPLPPQGWKIHISSSIEQSQETLSIVANILFKKRIHFKYVMSRWDLFVKNSKYGDRSSSGKFITIYPSTEYVFYTLLDDLSNALKNMQPGPYILNDNRWMYSNVYFRYGGFVEMKSSDGQLCILDENNHLIPDRREPAFSLPPFVKVPEKLMNMEEEKNKLAPSSKALDDYDIIDAIHFSNGGGVYKAINKQNGQKIILKEGRPGAGLDSRNMDGFKRIEIEYNALKTLKEIPEVVNVYNTFKAWEHNYLVEDEVIGAPINTWVAQHYPFVLNHDNLQEYKEKALIVSKNLLNAIKKIHKAGIGMGDLSPANVLVSEDNKITLIDFEAAGDVNEKYKQSLQTPGFASRKAVTRKEADLFAVYRILLFVFMPISPVQDINRENEVKMLNWITQRYGKDVANVILDAQKHVTFNSKPFTNQLPITVNTLEPTEQILQKLIKGITENLRKKGPILLPGDIRQFELLGGKNNILTGGYGTLMALNRLKVPLNEMTTSWIKRSLTPRKLATLDDGLFTGKAGISCILYDLGYEEKALTLINEISISELLNTTDISLVSGLAGIGLAFLSLYQMTKNSEFLNNSKLIAERLEKLFKDNITVISVDPDFIPIGFLDGWAGAAFFLGKLFSVTYDKTSIQLAEKMFEKDYEKCAKDKSGILHVDDGFRLLPYLAGGSVGIAIVAKELNKITNNPKYLKMINEIKGITHTQCCYNPGLFRGYSSFIIMDTLLNKSISELKLATLYTFLVTEKDYLMCPGDYGYKFSGDIFSGATGVALALHGNLTHDLYNWIPVCKSSLN